MIQTARSIKRNTAEELTDGQNCVRLSNTAGVLSPIVDLMDEQLPTIFMTRLLPSKK